MNHPVIDGRSASCQIRDFSKTRGYINTPIDVMKSLEQLDCISRCIWLTLYQEGYFYEGAATVTLQDLADRLQISRSCLESRLKTLIESDYLIKQQNFDIRKQYRASTYFVRLPDQEIEKISSLPSRRESLDQVGRFVSKGLEKNDQISDPIEDLKTQIESLENTQSSELSDKVELLGLKFKLKSLSTPREKNLPPKISTPSPTKKGGSPAEWETKNNNQITDIKNNNKATISVQPSLVCSFASQGYKNTPVQLPARIKEKIHKAVKRAHSIALPKNVIAEGEFAVARCFTGSTLEHAANTFCKLLREGRWTTPISMRSKDSQGCCV